MKEALGKILPLEKSVLSFAQLYELPPQEPPKAHPSAFLEKKAQPRKEQTQGENARRKRSCARRKQSSARRKRSRAGEESGRVDFARPRRPPAGPRNEEGRAPPSPGRLNRTASEPEAPENADCSSSAPRLFLSISIEICRNPSKKCSHPFIC